MKILLLATLLVASQAQARTAAEACRELTTFNPSLGVDCVAAVTKGQVQPDAVSYCVNSNQFNPNEGVRCLKEALNKRYEAPALKACQDFTRFSPASAVPCLQKIEGKTYSKDELSMCESSGQFNPSAGLACMEKLGKKETLFGCPSNQDLIRAVRSVRANLKAQPIDFNQSMVGIIDQVMAQIDRAAIAERTLSAIEISLATCER